MTLRTGIIVVILLARDAKAGRGAASTAFFYGPAVPRELFDHYDRVVVDPDHVPSPPRGAGARAFAYVSLGEVHPSRPWRTALPERLVLGRDAAFGSEIVDTSSSAWAAFVLDRVVSPLYAQGYRGFFFDTLDSYRKLSPTPAQVAAHVAGLRAIVRAVKRRHPDARILLNRGFELLPAVAGSVDGVVAESLFESYDHASRRYAPVPAREREALLALLREVTARHGLPVTVIDYVPATDPDKRAETARRILRAGFEPWVTGPALDEIGVGRVRVVPRKVMVVYRHEPTEGYLGVQDACVLVAPALEHLGFVPEYVDVRGGLPARNLAGQYAGVVLFLPDGGAEDDATARWIARQLDSGLRIAFLHGFGFTPPAALLARLGLGPANDSVQGDLRLVAQQKGMTGFEAPVRARRLERPPFRAAGADVRSLLRVGDDAGGAWDGVVLGPWGGAAFDPYVLEEGLGGERRWILDPFAFLRAALALPPIPAPDVTTESGRRVLTAHVDGDAFYSRAERRGAPYTASVLLEEIFEKHRFPHTVSIVEGEIGPEGLIVRPPPGRPSLEPADGTVDGRLKRVAELEGIARRVFALPWVEIASHTYSHPFFWEDAEAGKTAPHGVEPVFLPVDGYVFSLEREIAGSIGYIERRLAPPGKRVRVLLWSGDCAPSAAAVETATRLGVLNVNGGGATRTRARPSLTLGSALGIPKEGGGYQVFAPVENENVYTNDFLGPYYGYRRAIETFELNDVPRRLSPISIYYHFYSAAKPAALAALKEVYAWASAQETTPLYLSEYAAKVLAFQAASLAVRLEDGAWQIKGLGPLRTLRLDPAIGWPDLDRSPGVAGVREVPQGRFVTISADVASVVLATSKAPPAGPRLESANGKVLTWRRDGGRIALDVAGHVPLQMTIAGARACTLRGPQAARVRALAGDRVELALTATQTGRATLECR